jgi:pimeloyl-ACP methyl ester carboxylesterase
VPELSANGARFHVQVIDPPGAAHDVPTVVFLHGLMVDDLSSFYYSLAGLAQTVGVREVMYDLRGHGRSERTAAHYSTHDSVADLFALLDALGMTGPVYLVGNSYGGLIAARAAVAAPGRVAGLAMVEASCAGPAGAAWLEDMTNTLTLYALRLEYDRQREKLAAIGERRLARLAKHAEALLTGTSLLDDLATEQPLGPSELAAIGCPVLAVFGESSELAGAADELRRHVRDAAVEIIPGVAHYVLREAIGPLRDILAGWLKAQEAVR